MTNPAPLLSCDATPEGRALAASVARGVLRLFARHDIFGMTEVPLPNGRRLDIMAIDARGQLIAVEIKCSRADLLGDGKWQDYYDYCDRYFWAVPAGFDIALLDLPILWPERSGVIVADAYDAEIIRPAAQGGDSALRPPLRAAGQRNARPRLRGGGVLRAYHPLPVDGIRQKLGPCTGLAAAAGFA